MGCLDSASIIRYILAIGTDYEEGRLTPDITVSIKNGLFMVRNRNSDSVLSNRVSGQPDAGFALSCIRKRLLR